MSIDSKFDNFSDLEKMSRVTRTAFPQRMSTGNGIWIFYCKIRLSRPNSSKDTQKASHVGMELNLRFGNRGVSIVCLKIRP
jgi:hypothetical protein